MKKWKWIHRWFSLILGVFLILWAVSGVVLNHRGLVSNLEVNRNILPPEYRLSNWNNAAVRSGVELGGDSILIYGNIGIWLTNSTFSAYKPFDNGMPQGIDSKRISKIVKTTNGDLFAGTQSGLYHLVQGNQSWKKIPIPLHDKRIADITIRDSLLVVMSRSALYTSVINENDLVFSEIILPASTDDDGKTGLFRTLWVIHSGEIFGFVGKLIVDFLALVLIFLVITGYIYFFFPKWVKKRKAKKLASASLISSSRFSVKWHNKIGIWIGSILIITTLTGMFLRPPLLITIASARVGKIPFSVLNHPNIWNDRLRAIIWDESANHWLIGTNDGLFSSSQRFDLPLERIPNQPPISVMGINVLDKYSSDTFLIGSFNGVFLWQPKTGFVRDYISGEIPARGNSTGSPIGNHLITGRMLVSEQEYIFEYNNGLMGHNIPMPTEIIATPLPLWNVALEVHTARIFQNLIGIFYILIIPLFGISTLLILISGILVWYRKWKNKRII